MKCDVCNNPMTAVQGIGAVLVIIDLVFYARMKGRPGIFGVLGLLSCLGLITLGLLSKTYQNCGASASYRVKGCGNCGAPV